MGFDDDFLTRNFGGSPTMNLTNNNCLSADATAGDFGGSGNVLSETDTDVFTDPSSADYTLKAGSAALDTGKDLSGSFTADILDVTRDASFDIGAFEYPAASGRIMSSLVGAGGLAGYGGIAGQGGGLAG